jgi:hypothetical protein
LEGNTFTSAGQIMAKVNEIPMDISLPEFISILDEWKRRFAESIDTGGNYLYTQPTVWPPLVPWYRKTKYMSGDRTF